MLKKLWRLLVITSVLFVSMFMSTTADADVVLSNLPHSTGSSGLPVGKPIAALEYEPYMVVDIPVGMDATLNSFSADMYCTVCPVNVLLTVFTANGSNEPGPVVGGGGAVNVTTNSPGTIYQFAGGGLALTGGTRYIFKMNADLVANPSASAIWVRNGSSAAPTGSWAYVETAYFISVNGNPGTFQHGLNPNTVEIDATLDIGPTPTPTPGPSPTPGGPTPTPGSGGGGGGGFHIPQVGMIQISKAQQQPAYTSPGQGIAKTADGVNIILPFDADGGGSDTYVVTRVATVNGRAWVEIFLGSTNFGWVPLDSVTPITPLN